MTSRTWFFTWFGYDANTFCILDNYPFRYFCVGEDICPTTGRPHLHGIMIFREPQRLSTVKSKISSVPHLEVPNKDDPDSYSKWFNYCRKLKNFRIIDRREKRGPKPRSGDPIPRQTVQLDDTLVETILRETIRNVKIV